MSSINNFRYNQSTILHGMVKSRNKSFLYDFFMSHYKLNVCRYNNPLVLYQGVRFLDNHYVNNLI